MISQRPTGGNIIAKLADCGSNFEFKMINIARTTKTIGSVRLFLIR